MSRRHPLLDRKPADAGPTPTTLASGDVERDAAYVLALPNISRRRHELWRLGHIHGLQYRAEVEYRVTQIWDNK